MVKTFIIAVILFIVSATAYAETNSLTKALEGFGQEMGSIFSKKSIGEHKSLKETSSEAWQWLWQ